MALPRVHSFTWSDAPEDPIPEATPVAGGKGPRGLKDKELHVWVTYPGQKPGKSKGKGKRRRGGRKAGGRKDLKLWAVMIIEALREVEPYTYHVTLRRIYKREDRIIEVFVKNDPADQSDDAQVFGFIRPSVDHLDSLEERLSTLAAKRVYDAIIDTWPEADRPRGRLAEGAGALHTPPR